MRSLDIVIADPAGNVTVFVLGAEDLGAEERVKAAKTLLADGALRAEQAGFVEPPPAGGGLWRLAMAGGEFCGNAARSLGLFAARKMGLAGKHTLYVEVSGGRLPVAVDVDCDTGYAAAVIEPPDFGHPLLFDGKPLDVYQFDGIVHIIAEDITPEEGIFFRIKELFEADGKKPRGALGVMFFDTAKSLMSPAVYVYEAGSFVFESSCGSGSAALACHRFRKTNSAAAVPVKQPGGIITAQVAAQDGRIKNIKIGGRVALCESRFQFDIPPSQNNSPAPFHS